MKKLLLLALLPSISLAGTATLTWVPPTEKTDGSTYTDYGGYRIYYNLEGQPLDIQIDIPDPTNVTTTHTIEDLAAGNWLFQMTAYDSSGAESDRTNTVSKLISSVPPLPPDPSFVTTETQVYNVVKRNDGFALIYVGTVPLNTPCDPSQTVNGKFAVPVSAVSWAGTVRPIVVLATCSAN